MTKTSNDPGPTRSTSSSAQSIDSQMSDRGLPKTSPPMSVCTTTRRPSATAARSVPRYAARRSCRQTSRSGSVVVGRRSSAVPASRERRGEHLSDASLSLDLAVPVEPERDFDALVDTHANGIAALAQPLGERAVVVDCLGVQIAIIDARYRGRAHVAEEVDLLSPRRHRRDTDVNMLCRGPWSTKA